MIIEQKKEELILNQKIIKSFKKYYNKLNKEIKKKKYYYLNFKI